MCSLPSVGVSDYQKTNKRMGVNLLLTALCVMMACSVSAEMVANWPSSHHTQPTDEHHGGHTHHRHGDHLSDEPPRHDGRTCVHKHLHRNHRFMPRCMMDFKHLCRQHIGSSVIQQWQCMADNVDRISDDACLAMVKGMRACRRFAASVCEGQVLKTISSLRRCLHRVNMSQIPSECRESRFFNRIVLFRTFHPWWHQLSRRV